MKFKALIILLILIPFTSSGQKSQERLDTIVLLSNKKLIVKVKTISSTTIHYFDFNTSTSSTLDRKQVQQIIYCNGRKEIFNKPIFSVVKEGDWKTIIVTDNKNDVENLVSLGSVYGKSKAGTGGSNSAKRSAIIRMQKSAVNIGAVIVLVTKEEPIGGFGEEASYYIEGIAYGYEK